MRKLSLSSNHKFHASIDSISFVGDPIVQPENTNSNNGTQQPRLYRTSSLTHSFQRLKSYHKQYLKRDRADSVIVEGQLTKIKTKSKWVAHSSDIYCLKLIKNGALFATASLDLSIKIWDMQTLNCRHSLQGHSDSITCLATDDEFLFSGSLDGTILKWNIVTGACLSSIMTGHGRIRAVSCFSSWLITGGWDESIRVWNKSTETLVREYKLNRGPIVNVQVTDRLIIVATKGEGTENEITILDFGNEEETDTKPRGIPSVFAADDTPAQQKRLSRHIVEISEETIQIDESTDYQPCTEGYDTDDYASDDTWEDAKIEECAF
ncbi:hypothetical protein HDU97_003476 [Phlyctochytrium planicorne]|nr:hypothetical protein HDU97_003476 [Phlyctochytrium planicorne]